MTRVGNDSSSRSLMPMQYMDVDELMVVFGYASRNGVLASINRGYFPLKTFKHGNMRVALRADCIRYFAEQTEAAAKQAAERGPPQIDKRLIARERREGDRERKLRAIEAAAPLIAQKELKRKEAAHRRLLKAAEKAREIASRGILGGTRTS